MKAFNVKCCLIAVLSCLIVCLFAVSFFTADTAYASSHSGGDSESTAYKINSFNAVYDIDKSGYMCVTEIISVTYTGAQSYAVTRTMVDDSSDRVRNISVTEEEDGEYVETEFSIDSESGDVEITIGDEDSKTNETHIYKIYYEYYRTDQSDSGLVIYPFSGIEAEIKEAVITINLPFECSCTCSLDGTEKESTTGEAATINLSDLASGTSVLITITSVNATFSGYSDYSGYYALVILAVIAILLVAVKLIFFNKYKLKTEIRKEPPFGYDPLIVGKLVDNSVSDADVASLILHWAAKGYITLNLKVPEKPVLTKLRNLPAISSDYEQILFYKLFKHTNVVYLDELDEDFYKTTEAVKKAVDKKAAGSYQSKSIGISVLFGLLAALVAGAAPTIYAMVNISASYIYITGLIFTVPPLIVYGLMESLMYNRYKLHRKDFAKYLTGIIAICVVCTGLYMWAVPSNIIEMVPKLLISVVSYTLAITSTLLITRTEKYNEQLGEILGFRKFIKTSQHLELREMAEKDNMIFYEIYPYAQVLNIEKEWTDKFYSMNFKAPEWGVPKYETGEVSAKIAAAMKTARMHISIAISTSPNATKRKKVK